MFRARVLIDAVAALLIFAATAYFFTGTTAHEWLGVAAVGVLLAHNFLNRRFWTKLFPPRKKIRAMATAILNVALAAATLAVAVSGAMLSDAIFPFVPSGDGLFARELHTTSAAWLFVLCAVHAGVHAPFFSSALKNIFCKKSWEKKSGESVAARAGKIAAVVAALALSAYGVRAFFVRAFPQKLFAESTFDAFAFDDTATAFFSDYVCIAALFFCGAALVKKYFPR